MPSGLHDVSGGNGEKLRMLAKQTDAIVVTGHDLEGWKQFKKVPDFYA